METWKKNTLNMEKTTTVDPSACCTLLFPKAVVHMPRYGPSHHEGWQMMVDDGYMINFDNLTKVNTR